MTRIPRTVWILALTSLFTDLASEMLYPVWPAYLQSLGYSLVWIGILEGSAACLVGLSKGYFGRESDRIGQRLPFIKTGYTLSALAKPMMAISTYLGIVFTARITDRLGKGIRTAARDAMLSQSAPRKDKGKIFGFHRSWDTAGAVAGPLIALAYLYFHPGAYKPLFLIAFLPGIISVLLLFKLKEQGKEKNTHIKNQFFSYFTYFKQSPAPFRWLVGGLCIFALANSSDVFLLLRAGEVLKDEQQVILGYLLYNLVYALSAYPLGILADRIGLKKMLLAGMGIFVFAYTGFALSQSPMVIYALFGLYGLFAASTEGVAKAWIANLVPEVECGTAMGLFASLQSIGIFIASSMTGWIWEKSGYTTAFYISVLLAVLAIIWIAGFAKNMMPERA